MKVWFYKLLKEKMLYAIKNEEQIQKVQLWGCLLQKKTEFLKQDSGRGLEIYFKKCLQNNIKDTRKVSNKSCNWPLF